MENIFCLKSVIPEKLAEFIEECSMLLTNKKQ